MQQMGRFTLRDEGRTIAIGKVLKYKPYNKGIVGASKTIDGASSAAASKTIVSGNSAPKEVVFNMETGETSDKPKQMEAIAEGDEDEQ